MTPTNLCQKTCGGHVWRRKFLKRMEGTRDSKVPSVLGPMRNKPLSLAGQAFVRFMIRFLVGCLKRLLTFAVRKT
jgi:tRNA U38,U39,U40 pseudouridine synthase TruA